MKIKKESLRLGCHTKQGRIVSFYESGIHVGLGKTHSFSDVAPITLNYNWAVRLGFTPNGSRHERLEFFRENETKGFGCVFLCFDEKKDKWFFSVDTFMKEIEFVHEVQNLHSCIVGEEIY